MGKKQNLTSARETRGARFPQRKTHRKLILIVFVVGVCITLLAPADSWFELLAVGAVGAIHLWVPWFWVWDVPRRYFMQSAPIQYVQVFGWAAMVFWYAWAIYLAIDNFYG